MPAFFQKEHLFSCQRLGLEFSSFDILRSMQQISQHNITFHFLAKNIFLMRMNPGVLTGVYENTGC